jgi:hypothetical protein
MLLMTVIHVDAEMLQAGQAFSKELLYLMFAGMLGGYLGYLFTRKRMEDLPEPNSFE